MHLTVNDIAAYREQGYLQLGRVLSDRDVAELREAYDECLDRGAGDRNIRPTEDDNGNTMVVNQIRVAHLQHERFAALLHDDRLLDPIEQLLGPNVRLVLFQGLYKPPHHGGEIGWHQDDYYFRVDKPDAVVSVWLTLDDVTVDNGCMWVLPGWHREMREHEGGASGGYAMQDADESLAVPLEMDAGHAMMHHGLTPHRTLANRTDGPRRALALHFMDGMAKPTGDNRMAEPAENMPVLRGGSVSW